MKKAILLIRVLKIGRDFLALTYGYFNSVNGDRKYDAETMSKYFSGIISRGVLQNYGNSFQVFKNSGMIINVSTGKAYFSNGQWVENDAIISLNLDAASVSLPRIDRIVLRKNTAEEGRNVSLVIKKGIPSSSPVVPSLENTDYVEEMSLCQIYVGANVSEIVQANITDERSNSALCGFTHQLFDQVDTTEIFAQYDDAFNTWFNDVKENFRSATLVRQYTSNYTTQTANETIIPINIPQFNINLDILNVYINGLKLVETVDYTKTMTQITLILPVYTGTQIEFEVFKSVNTEGAETIVEELAENVRVVNSHIANKNNPHEVTVAQIGAVPTSRTVNSMSLSSDITLSAADVGAAASSHDHSASDITSGTLPIARGGTGASSIIDVHSSLSLNQVVNYETFIVTGDGNETKTHTFDFEPDCVFVFRPSQGFMKYTSDGAINYVNFGMAIKIGSRYYNSLGVNLNGNNLTLTQYSVGSSGYLVNLNASGEKYMIVAFKPHIKELTPNHLVGDGQASKIYPSKVDPRFVLIGKKDQGQIKYDSNMVYNIINCGAAIQAGSEAVSTLGTTFDGNALTLEQYSTKSNGYYVNLNTNSGGYIYCDFDPHVIGNYETFLLSGDGNSTKTHTLSFAPKFVFICKLDQAIAKYDGNMIYNIVNGGMAAKIGSTNYGTLGVALSGNNLTLTQYTTKSNGYYVNLNSNGGQYMCIAFK